MNCDIYATIQQHVQEMDIAFQRVVSAVLKYSKLEVSLIRISNVTEDSFYVSLEARASNTGPVKAVLSPMTLDLCAPSGSRFGHITLPELATQPGGAPIAVENQLVRITDRAALLSFVGAVIRSADTALGLCNGQASLSVPALRVGPRPVCYERQIPISGMNGPKVSVQSVSIRTTPTPPLSRGTLVTSVTMSSIDAIAGSSSTNYNSSRIPIAITLQVLNPSPVEISFGTCEFEIRSASNEVLAALKGRLGMRREAFDATLLGVANKHVATAMSIGEGQARLIGRKCTVAGWCDVVIKAIDVPIAETWKVLQVLDVEYEYEKEKPLSDDDNGDEKGVFCWRGSFWRKRS
ncbi:hypothetical protein AAE478_005952 [Parahypoxylon ruwenzoriense]